MIATLSLNPSVDIYFGVDKLHTEDTTRAQTERRMAGGKALNVSRVLSELGTPTKAFALVGGSTGDEYVRLAREAHIPHAEVRVHGRTRTNVVIFDAFEESERRVSGLSPHVVPADVRRLAKKVLSANPEFIVMNGALPASLSSSTYADLTALFAERGIGSIVDADGEALKRAIQARVKPVCIKPNEHELERLVGRALKTPTAVIHAALRASEWGIRHVIVSMGPQGAVFVHQGLKPFLIRPPKLKLRSRVAAGDSLLAGFLHSLARGDDAEKASLFAVAAASSCVSRPSGAFAQRTQTRSFIRQLKIRPLR